MAERPVLAVAHRAGNSITALRAALDAGVDLVETDIHLFRGALEVRHAKAIGPHLCWERWAEVRRRRGGAVPDLAEVLTEAEGDSRLMLDLKGRSVAVAQRVAAVLRVAAPGVPVTVCTKHSTAPWPTAGHTPATTARKPNAVPPCPAGSTSTINTEPRALSEATRRSAD